MREVARRDVLEGAAGISSVAPLGKIQQSTSDGETNSKRVNYLRINFELTSRPDEAAVDVAPRAWPAVLEHDNNFYLPEHVPEDDEQFVVAQPHGIELLNRSDTWEYDNEVPLSSNILGGSEFVRDSEIEISAIRLGRECYLVIGQEAVPISSNRITETKQIYFEHDGKYKVGNVKIDAEYHHQAEVIYSDEGYVLPNTEQAKSMVISKKERQSSYNTQAKIEIKEDQKNDSIVSNTSKKVKHYESPEYNREIVDQSDIGSTTLVLVVETTRSEESTRVGWHAPNVKRNFVTKWNDQIAQSPDYTLGALSAQYISGPDAIDLPEPDTAKEGMQNANDWISNNQRDWKRRFDAIIVLDDVGLVGTNGRAPKGDKSTLIAGSDGINVGYADDSFSSGLALHELGHMYGGRHTHHRKRGFDKFTVMGNRGKTTCGGNKSEYWRTRNERFSDCAKSSIREYMEYWNERGYF